MARSIVGGGCVRFVLSLLVGFTMKIPSRIQRLRLAGSVTPKRTRYCGRPGIFGNPFDTKEEFFSWVRHGNVPLDYEGLSRDELGFMRQRIWSNLYLLLDYDHLSCWCGLKQDCHVDVIVDLLREHYIGLYKSLGTLPARSRGGRPTAGDFPRAAGAHDKRG